MEKLMGLIILKKNHFGRDHNNNERPLGVIDFVCFFPFAAIVNGLVGK